MEAFKNVLNSGHFILESNVESFGKNFTVYNNVKYWCGVTSGLDALILSIKAFDLKVKSEIIVPANTYIANILSVIHANQIPVLFEPDINTYNIIPELIEKGITKKQELYLWCIFLGNPVK